MIKQSVKIINLSSRELSNDEISLLNRGLKFVPTPKSPNILDLEIDIKEFIRKLKLKEFFYNNKNISENGETESIVVPKSDFIPYKVKSPALDAICLNLEHNAENLQRLVPKNTVGNLSSKEEAALEALKRDEMLVIKRADKGGGIVIMDTDFYVGHMTTELNKKTVYKKHNENIDNKLFGKVKKFVEDNKSILTKKERDYVIDIEPTTANIYGLPKIHKSNLIKSAIQKTSKTFIHLPRPSDLQFRFIIGGPNAPTNGLSTLLNILLFPFISKIKSYIKDSTDFLVKLDRFENISLEDITLATVDISNMYGSITKNLGLKAIRYFIDTYPELLNTRFNKEFIIKGLKIVLDNNLCHFNDQYFSQISGTYTGTTVAPTYANLTLAYLEIILEDKLKEVYSEDQCNFIIKNWKRYLDDAFLPWRKSFGDFKVFIDILNSLDQNINFTYELNETQIAFLNILIYKDKKGLKCDMYFKPTDTREYLPFNSCHPHHTKVNIPFTLARNICTIVEDRDRLYKQLGDLYQHLIKCGYPSHVILNAINIMSSYDQSELRKYKEKCEEETIVFTSTFNPKNPNVSEIINNNIKSLKDNLHLNKIFGQVNFIKSKREPPSLGDLLTRSSFSYKKPTFGVKKCNSSKCKTCDEINITDDFNFHKVDQRYKIRQVLDCRATNCIYVLTCMGCNEYYIGKADNLRVRNTKHRFDIKNYDQCLMAVDKHVHFCGKGRFKVTPFYKMKREGIIAHLTTEEYFIRKYEPSLNKRI